MIEKVARAIASADPDQGGQINDSEMGDYFWEKYRDHYMMLARAAIEAMRDPTQAMCDSMNDDIDWDGDAVRAYVAGIDAALQEKP